MNLCFGLAFSRTCNLIDKGADLIISKTSCESADTIKFLASGLNIQHIYLTHTTECIYGKDYGTGNTPDPTFNAPIRTSVDAVAHLLARITEQLRWKHIVVFHDTVSPDQVETFTQILHATVDETVNIKRSECCSHCELDNNAIISLIQHNLSGETSGKFNSPTAINVQKRNSVLRGAAGH